MPRTAEALPFELQRLDGTHPLHRMGLHGHAFFELMLIEEAGGPHRVGGEAHATEPGTLFLIAPGELHDCRAIGGATGWVLLFTHEALDGTAAASRAYSRLWPTSHPLLAPFLAFGGPRRRPPRLPAADLAHWSRRLAELANELDARRPGYRHGAQAHLTLVLLDAMRLFATPAAAPDLSAANPLLSDVFAFIDRTYARPISARDVARSLDRSVAHLTTVVRRRTGLTIGAWIAQRRMAEARRLLAATALDLPAVADRSGYSDAGAFARAFRRLHGASPAAWRSANRNAPPYG